ncbi:MAG TPA: hypothetical protein VGQ75_06385 [Thermoanaerobaculia bacterium]|jgi:hypothetical protein|nr:hypothetical protein [Thermoanaerobaculia bacterium]HEV8608631.1 hypothetical protein [Thermoanaerobaculia bacterium]
MRSVADRLREEQREELRRMTVSERLALAFRLGEDDVSFFAAARGIDRARAAATLARTRRRGRRLSRCLDETD